MAEGEDITAQVGDKGKVSVQVVERGMIKRPVGKMGYDRSRGQVHR